MTVRLALFWLLTGCAYAASRAPFDIALRVLAPPAGPKTVLSLDQAVDLAFQNHPRLRAYIESVEQARRLKDVAYAPFLPTAALGLSAGTSDLNVDGNITPGGALPGFSFVPALGSIPNGLRIDSTYELADLKLQWLICDFGRREGRFAQAKLGAEIAELECQRAYQTVAHEVAIAYYQLLRARALSKTAREAVRRAKEALDVAQKLLANGALERASVLRVSVLLAEDERLLDSARSAATVALAALNQAIGLNVNAATDVQETTAIPEFDLTLAACLSTAVEQRRELRVARDGIEVARQGRRVAKAEQAPSILATGAVIQSHTDDLRSDVSLTTGGVKVEWGLFEGGRRTAERRVADAKLRAALAQAETIADTVAFQVTGAYAALATARRGIDRSELAVEHAEESRRLVRARADQGDATAFGITDSESALVRAQQDHLNSIHDHLIARARLEHAMGMTRAPSR
jgi:outer membrane protein